MSRAAGGDAARFAKLGLHTAADFVLHLPIRYEDRTRIVALADVRDGQTVQVEGTVVRSEIVPRPRRILQVELRDAGTLAGTSSGPGLGLRFFHFYPSQPKQFAVGRRVRAYGEVRIGLFGATMVHPQVRFVTADEALPEALTPVYPTVAGLSQARLRAAISSALDGLDESETVPADVVARLGLPPLAEALRTIHRPAPGVSLDALADRSAPAWRRVIFDELLAQRLSLMRARQARARQPAPVLADDRLAASLLATLPFAPTRAQTRVWQEIAADLAHARPMNRLLQGDVGSGKTLIAALAALQAIGSGWQVALMAPTEILAEQHYQRLRALFRTRDDEAGIGAERTVSTATATDPTPTPEEPANGSARTAGTASAGPESSAQAALSAVRVGLLTGSLKESERRSWRARATAGTVDLLIGTHALIADGVAFARPGLMIVDEQHRFGVAQRLALRAQIMPEAPVLPNAADIPNASGIPNAPDVPNALAAHQLTLSATPIPRTLAMTYYADLDVSVLDELPPGRTPVATRLISQERRAEVIARVRAAAQAGRQVYWVCPLIDESETLDLQTAIDTHAALTQELAPLGVGLVHGRMPPAAKQEVMAAFAAGHLPVLVATTVIEVGVDVPNASLLIVEHAERFGLAQLHQLRGRVGRGTVGSVCVLLYREPLSPLARERLKTMYETTDGFEVARRDLLQRGPGEFLGARQSGAALLRFADLTRDSDLVEAARAAAEQMLHAGVDGVDAHLRRWLGAREEYLKA